MMQKVKKELKPKLRFPEFRDDPGWAEATIGNLINTVTPPKKLQTSEYQEAGKFPVIDQSKDFLCGWTDDSDALVADPLPVIVFGDHTCALKLVTLPFAQGADGIKIIDTKSIVQVEFLYQYLRFKPLKTESYKRHFSTLKKQIAFYPNQQDQAEQTRIAECLSSLDELIAAHERKLELLKDYKKGLMQSLFPRPGETQPRLRFPEFRDGPEWKEMKLGDAAIFYNGRAYKKEELLSHGKYKVLRVGNFFTTKDWYFSNLELDGSKYCKNGDLLYAWSASFGPHFWYGEKTIYHYHIWKVVEKDGIRRDFLAIVLEYETERMKQKASNGLGLLHITKSTIEGWDALFPEPDEQIRISECLSSLGNLITAQALTLEKVKTHKKGLMQQLFPSLEEDVE